MEGMYIVLGGVGIVACCLYLSLPLVCFYEKR